MTELINFLWKHWLLSGGFGILLVLLLINEIRQQIVGRDQLDAQGTVRMINHNHAVLVDIRDPDSFAKAHIVGAINVPKEQFSEKVNLLNKYKEKPIILLCATGSTAPFIIVQLKKMGFEQVYCLAGGILAWQTDNLPLITKNNINNK